MVTSKEKIELAQKQSIQIEIKSDENIECVTPIQTETKRMPPPPARKNINNESNDNQQQKKEEELPNYDEIIVNEQQNNESELDNNVSNDNNETVENESSQTQNDKQNEMEMNDENMTNHNEYPTNEIVTNENEDHIFAETQQNEQHIEVEPVSDHNLQSIVKEDKMNENDQTNEYSSNHRIEIESESNEKITEKHEDNAMIIIPPSIPPINNEEITEKIKALTPKTSETAMDNIAIATENESDLSSVITEHKSFENKPSKISANESSKPIQSDVESKENTLPKTT